VSTAIMTWAQRVQVQPLDSSNNPTLGTFNVQVNNTELSQTQNDVDITNSESNGIVQFAPTILIPEFNIDGIVDTGEAAGAYEAMWFTTMQNQRYATFNIFFNRRLNTTVYYVATVLIKSAQVMGKTNSSGDVWRFSIKSKGVTNFTKFNAGGGYGVAGVQTIT
jgi:hypothetical protein